MLLKSGKRVKVRHKQSGEYAEVAILNADEQELILLILSDLKLYPGDEIELEFLHCKGAFYILQASVLEVNENKVYVLLEQAGLCRLQRRKAERTPAKLNAEYHLLPKKDPRPFQEGSIQNISQNGMLLSVKEPLELGSELFLTFEVPGGRGKACTTGIKGKVVREHRGPTQKEHNYGVEFERPIAFADE